MRFPFRFWAASLACAASLSLPAAAQSVTFEVFSIKPIQPGSSLSTTTLPSPNGYVARLSLWQALQLAYSPEYNGIAGYAEIINSPKWAGDFYDIHARVAQADLKAWQSQSRDHELLRAAMRAALKERCKLAIHEQPSRQPNFELVVSKRGPRLKPAVPGSTLPTGVKLPSGGVMVATKTSITGWQYYGATIGDLISFLNPMSHNAPIRDKTNLTGRYDFTLQRIDQPAQGSEAVFNFPVEPLGLLLKPGTESRPIFVIDHIEKPTAN